MDLEESFILYAYVQLGLMYMMLKRRRKCKRWANRRWLVRPINTLRRQQGDFRNLFQEMKLDQDLFFRYTRMDSDTFTALLDLLKPHLTKKSPKALPPEQRLAITLRYLATGDQMLSIALAYRVGESTAYAVVKETCTVIASVLAPIYLRVPDEDEWKKICAGFLEDWNFPNCVGAIDGKHVNIQAPPNSGSLYYNYKKNFSMVLLAVCDHKYKFTLVDFGSYGSSSGAGVFVDSKLASAIGNNSLQLPKGITKLPGCDSAMPCFFIGDEAFPLSTTMMRPYSGRHLCDEKRIFNYRLSRARRTIENTFGILVSRWRVLRKPICMHPASVDKIVMSALCLHNFLKTVNDRRPVGNRIYCPPNFVDSEDNSGNVIPGTWRSTERTDMQKISNTGPCRATRNAYKQRDTLKQYFLTPEGEVPWQDGYILRGRNAN